jgi:hypothetical protein
MAFAPHPKGLKSSLASVAPAPTHQGHLIIACGFALLALVITAPLVTCLETCVGPSFDPLVTIWSMGWTSHSLFGGRGRLFDGNLFYPYPLTLALGESALTDAVLVSPVVALTQNPVLGHNIALLLTYFLAGLGTYLLAFRLTRRLGPALFSGVAFASAPFLVHNSYNLQSLACAFVPWVILSADRLVAAPTWGRCVALWTAMTALTLASVNLAVYGGVSALIYIVVSALLSYRDLARAHFIRFALVAPPFLALNAWAYLPYLTWHTQFARARSLADAALFSASMRTYYSVSDSNLLHRLTGLYPASALDTSPGFVGWTVVALAAFGVIAVIRAQRLSTPPTFAMGWAPLAMTVFAFVMSFGPTITIAGRDLPLPYRLLFALPGVSGLRTPARLVSMVVLGCSLLAALGLGYLNSQSTRRGRRFLGLIVSLSLIVELAAFPSSSTALRYPDILSPHQRAVLAWIMDQPKATRLLEIPLNREELLYDAAVHGRRYINGFSSYEPPLYRELALELAAFPGARARSLVSHLPVDYIIAETSSFSPRQMAELNTAAEFEGVASFGPVRILRVRQEALTGLALSVRPPAFDDRRLALEIRNSSAQPLLLYPLHTVRARAHRAGQHGPPQSLDLPLWLTPGDVTELYLDPPASDGDIQQDEVVGTVEFGRNIRSFVRRIGEPLSVLGSGQSD